MTLSPGFESPVLDSQACFRAVLDAMARPGTIHLVDTLPAPPAPLHRATAAVLLTLVDSETPLWLDPAAAAAADWITFHCGAPQAPLATAQFALALSPLPLTHLHPGSDEAPEQGATLILQLPTPAFAPTLGTGLAYRLEGPGLPAPTLFHIAGLPEPFAAEWAANQASFPRGIDLILCAGNHLAAFPRTLTVRPA